MSPELLHALQPYVLGLVALLLFGVVAWIVRSELGPIFTGIVSGLTAHATKNATGYALGALMALLASLDALGDVATANQWPLIAAACKVLQPGIAAIVAAAMRSQNGAGKDPGKSGSGSGTTTPPFPPASP